MMRQTQGRTWASDTPQFEKGDYAHLLFADADGDAFQRRMRRDGFSIVELILVFAVIGILCALAVPLGTKILANQRLNAGAAALRSALTLARSKAMANPAVHCGVLLHAGRRGMLVFFDDDGDGQYDSTGVPDRIYQRLQTLPAGIRFDTTSTVCIFRGDGSARHGGTIRLRSHKTNRIKRVTITKESGEAMIVQ